MAKGGKREAGSGKREAGSAKRKRPTKAASTARAKAKEAELERLEPTNGSESGTTSLVIVEPPAKAKTIGKYLGRAYRVRATIVHVRHLPEKKMGIDIENGLEPENVMLPGKANTLAVL